jgi:hypothetical protein
LLNEQLGRKRKETARGSKAKVTIEAKAETHSDDRPGAIGALFGDGEET